MPPAPRVWLHHRALCQRPSSCSCKASTSRPHCSGVLLCEQGQGHGAVTPSWGDAGSWGVCRGHLLEELTDHHVGPRRLHRQGEGEQQGNPELRGKPASSKRDPRVVSSKHRGGEGDTVGLLRRSSRSSMASAGAGDCSHRALGCWRHMGTKPLVCDTLRDAPSCEAPSG